MPVDHHKHKVVPTVACAVLTISDTRTAETDTGGSLIEELLTASGHRVHCRKIVKDEPEQVRRILEQLRDEPACDVVLLTGGTGIASRDTTYEAVVSLLDKRLDGFGELFRSISHQRIGPAAMLSRATAGVMHKTAVFSMPGSPAAVELAMKELILPELTHIVCLLGER